MRINRVGEFELIRRLTRLVPTHSNRVLVGIGDDAAVLRGRCGERLLLTADAMVEGVHFDLAYTTLGSLGYKALAVNLSDVAAVGGTPLAAVVSIAVPPHWSVEDVESLYVGLARCGKMFDCPISGGDTVRSLKGCFISVVVLGETVAEKAILRSNARAGDFLCLTGEVGGARTGFEVLSSKATKRPFRKSIHRFLEPFPRLKESRTLVRNLPVTSMIDISDGLASEIRHLCEQSGVGCLIREEWIPLSTEAVLWAEKTRRSHSDFLYSSGEEYELLFTVSRSAFKKGQLFNCLAKRLGVSVIGEMTKPEQGIHVLRDGKRISLPVAGWDHFLTSD